MFSMEETVDEAIGDANTVVGGGDNLLGQPQAGQMDQRAT